MPFGSISQSTKVSDVQNAAAPWIFSSQSVYGSHSTSFRPQDLLILPGDNSSLSRAAYSLDECHINLPTTNFNEPLDVSQLTGVPFKQMTTAGRFGQGSRRAYGVMTNVTNGTPVLGNHRGQVHAMQSPTISSNTPQPKNPKLYKTELCRSWMDHGHCNYGDRCQYAHGEHEKRPIPRHPKYKTAYCQSFHQSGYCPYGPRCHFIHSEEPSTLNSQRSNRFTSNGGIVSPMTTNGFMITINGMSSSAAQQRACSSAGESPVPSSAGSGTESPNGSSSPSIDLDDSSGILSGGSWSTFIDAPRNIRRSHFEWPTPLCSEMALLDSSASQMAKSFGATPSQIPFDASISMMNDFMSWSLDEKQLSPKASSSSSGSGSICESTGRLPVFAQFSNSSAST